MITGTKVMIIPTPAVMQKLRSAGTSVVPAMRSATQLVREVMAMEGTLTPTT